MFLHCSTPMTKIGPTWAEVHAAAQEEKMARNQAATWEDIVSKQLPGDVENWDTEDSQSAVDPQFEDTHIEDEEDDDQVVIETVTEEELEETVAGRPPTQEFGEIAIGSASQEEIPTHAGEVEL